MTTYLTLYSKTESLNDRIIFQYYPADHSSAPIAIKSFQGERSQSQCITNLWIIEFVGAAVKSSLPSQHACSSYKSP